MFESDFEANQFALRQDKLEQIRALGVAQGLSPAEAIYPNHFRATHTIPELRAEYIDNAAPATAEQLESPRVEAALAGRLMQIRIQGKAGFAQLQQGGKRLQIYVRKDDVGETQFALYKLLDLGDHIGVRGYLFITRTGETTLHVTHLTFLAKAMLALPDKYHGLEDVELRYRQRYVDLFMNTGQMGGPAVKQTEHGPIPPAANNPDAGTELGAPRPDSGTWVGPAPTPDPHVTEAPPNVREVFVKRALILRALRTFFDSRGYLEVETPMMHSIAGGAAARPFTTRHNALDMELYLRIAPELYLKRLVVGGMDRVYEINRNFRNEGVSTKHNPEFTMLEFYQAYANYHDLMDLTEELIKFVAMEVNGSYKTRFNGVDIDLSVWKKYSMREAIIKFWRPNWAPFFEYEDNDFMKASRWLNKLSQSRDLLASRLEIAKSYDGIEVETLNPIYFPEDFTDHKFLVATIAALEGGEPLGKSIASVFEFLAEPHLVQPTIIYDFPLAVSPLSKVKPDEPDWVERFEFYIGGFEVGNAFSELNDPVDQLSRFEAQVAEKARGDDEAMEMDADYVRALQYGLPPTGGEGIGIDRLTMILTGQRSIRDVILFPLMRPIQKQQKPEEPHGESAE
ncbi:lysine--tRNA ligase [Granulicella tundricola]|uniref:Lysine--tRNA ligase n=1 Tax=Granulicella tundricola (strain ATCC BAA-1859 / DSM 23138 / MP5ACTX9) TaxID=1198114 RepID=E8X4P4_GRATM|nr:lysine--tRNA ligase [Granulicella tundricola]ADW69454.1 lysyl-tRNA synthetase [Granulicella tundricola MP5ACTX9]